MMRNQPHAQTLHASPTLTMAVKPPRTIAFGAERLDGAFERRCCRKPRTFACTLNDVLGSKQDGFGFGHTGCAVRFRLCAVTFWRGLQYLPANEGAVQVQAKVRGRAFLPGEGEGESTSYADSLGRFKRSESRTRRPTSFRAKSGRDRSVQPGMFHESRSGRRSYDDSCR